MGKKKILRIAAKLVKASEENTEVEAVKKDRYITEEYLLEKVKEGNSLNKVMAAIVPMKKFVKTIRKILKAK